ncbi:MAG: sel1 repeat family protein [Boseongicola sp.]|nr:sel1 repeat family protein [Boseongicola sp.]
MNLVRTFFLTVALGLLSGPAVFAQDFQKGLTAYNSGDYAEALKEWRALAERDDVYAQFNLGVMYYKGEGVPQDFAEALKWYRMAAEQGDALAQNSLGMMYQRGEGVSQNYPEAVKWFRKSAEQGNVFAQNTLGYLYSMGGGVPQDYLVAHMSFNIASANGAGKAGALRDQIAGLMTSAEITTAQAMARECMDSGYKKCGW